MAGSAVRAVLAAALLGPFCVAALAAASPLAAQTVPAAPDSTLRAAERAAREWLWLLDEERYDTAWATVSPAMRSVVGFAQWTTSLRRLRAASAFPRNLRRPLLRAEPSVPLFGGSSVILSFGVGNSGMREIVVLVRTGGRWLVGGYGILLY